MALSKSTGEYDATVEEIRLDMNNGSPIIIRFSAGDHITYSRPSSEIPPKGFKKLTQSEMTLDQARTTLAILMERKKENSEYSLLVYPTKNGIQIYKK